MGGMRGQLLGTVFTCQCGSGNSYSPCYLRGWFCLLTSYRCLDEAEKALRPAPPQIPDCPICGKQFLTAKSRISHLKQCAVRMEVGPQLLLQAVRLQTAQPEVGSSPQVPR